VNDFITFEFTNGDTETFHRKYVGVEYVGTKMDESEICSCIEKGRMFSIGSEDRFRVKFINSNNIRSFWFQKTNGISLKDKARLTN